MGKFDSKSFNEKAFKYSVERIPNLKINELKKSKALKGNSDIKDVFANQDGTSYARLAMKGLLEGDAVNYDGQTDITASSTKTFERGVVVVGRAKGFVEKDFSDDISGQDFMENVAAQIAEYKDGLDQDTILSILKGIFSMNTNTKDIEFVNKHTTEVVGNMTATTLNSATNKACGANKKSIRLAFMHSDVATNLENLRVIEYLKYTDKDGITRELEIATWNGRVVIVDDDMPVELVEATYEKTSDTEVDSEKTYYTRSGSASAGYTYTVVASPVKASLGDYYEKTAEAYTAYTTYVLGEGAIDYEDVGAKVPYEMDRNPAHNGGEDTLYIRQRKVFAPFGISYEKTSQLTSSPTNAELENGANWELVNSGESVVANRSYINHKAIPIVRIISRG